jgi:hypothetical protein
MLTLRIPDCGSLSACRFVSPTMSRRGWPWLSECCHRISPTSSRGQSLKLARSHAARFGGQFNSSISHRPAAVRNRLPVTASHG